MFDWFKKKEKVPQARHRDLIYLSNSEKWQALAALAQEAQPVVIMGWFAETVEKAKQALSSAGSKIVPQQAHAYAESSLQDKTLILLEHYPLPEKEFPLLSSTAPRAITVISSLDDPLFMYFGGERLKSLVEKLGMAPGETLEHQMITASIKRAQEKLSAKITLDFSARSQEEWFRKSGFEISP